MAVALPLLLRRYAIVGVLAYKHVWKCIQAAEYVSLRSALHCIHRIHLHQ